MPFPTGASFLGVAREITRGTFRAATDFIPIDNNADSPNDLPHVVPDTNLRGAPIDAFGETATQIWAEPSFSGNAFPDTLGFWLKNLLGDETSFGDLTGAVSTTLAADAAAGATTASITADPGGVGAVIQFGGSGLTRETRVITAQSGAGPYSVSFATPLDRTHTAPGVVRSPVLAPFTHTFALLCSGNFQPESLSLTDYNGDVARGIPGCLVASLVLKWSATGLLTWDVKLTGFQSAAQTKPSPAFGTEIPKPGWQAATTLGGVASSALEDGELTIERQIDVIPTANGTQTPYAIEGNNVSVKGKATMVYEAALYASEYSKLTGSTPTTLVFDWLSGTGAATREIKAQMSNLLYTSLKPSRGKSYVELPIEFKADGNTTDVGASGGYSPINVTLQNGRGAGY